MKKENSSGDADDFLDFFLLEEDPELSDETSPLSVALLFMDEGEAAKSFEDDFVSETGMILTAVSLTVYAGFLSAFSEELRRLLLLEVADGDLAGTVVEFATASDADCDTSLWLGVDTDEAVSSSSNQECLVTLGNSSSMTFSSGRMSRVGESSRVGHWFSCSEMGGEYNANLYMASSNSPMWSSSNNTSLYLFLTSHVRLVSVAWCNGSSLSKSLFASDFLLPLLPDLQNALSSRL